MTKAEYLELASQEWETINALQSETSFYEYEKTFDLIWTNLGQRVLERSISEPIKDRRKKKSSKAVTGT
jgi:hypothetical protein